MLIGHLLWASMKTRLGFTLIELLLVIGMIGILASVVILAIKPNTQIDAAQDAQRTSDIREIQNAIVQYLIDGNTLAALPFVPVSPYIASTLPTVDNNAVDICKEAYTGTDCTSIGGYDLATQVVPTYIAGIPIDPDETRAEFSGYRLWLNGSFITACSAYGESMCGSSVSSSSSSSSDSSNSSSSVDVDPPLSSSSASSSSVSSSSGGSEQSSSSSGQSESSPGSTQSSPSSTQSSSSPGSTQSTSSSVQSSSSPGSTQSTSSSEESSAGSSFSFE